MDTFINHDVNSGSSICYPMAGDKKWKYRLSRGRDGQGFPWRSAVTSERTTGKDVGRLVEVRAMQDVGHLQLERTDDKKKKKT